MNHWKITCMLRILGLAVCCWILMMGHYPPTAGAQEITQQQADAWAAIAAQHELNVKFEEHLEAHDRRLDAMAPMLEVVVTRQDVMQGKWDMVMGAVALLLGVFGGQLYLGWKKTKGGG